MVQILFINGQGRMSKMAAMPIYGYDLQNIFSRTHCSMILNLGIGGRGLKFYKVHINADPGFTLTDLTARSNLVTYAFRCRKTLIKPFNGKTL